MTHTEITLTEGDKLQLQWEKGFKNLSVFQNQQTIAFINDAELLKV